MNLDERLDKARDDYRDLQVPAASRARNVAAPTTAKAWHRRPGPAVAAAAVLVVGAIGGWALVRDRDQDRGAGGTVGRVRAQEQVEPPVTIDRPPGDPEVTLAPAGPYRDGQEVVVRFADEVDADVHNGIQFCVAVAVDEATTVERCEWRSASTPDPHAMRLAVPRSVVTPIGVRDCEDPDVDCRFVIDTNVLGRDGTVVLRSDPLRFTGPPTNPAPPSLTLTATGVGRLRVEPSGLVPDPTWLALREEHPGLVADLPAFMVSLCAPPGSATAPRPPGDADAGGGVGWGMAVNERTENCDVFGAPFTIDPDDPDAVVEVDVRRLVFGFAGRSDCASVRCYLVVQRATENQAVDGGVGGSSEAVTSAPLPEGVDLGPALPPTLVVETPGPHRRGDEIEVTVAGLPPGDERSVAPCTPATVAVCGLGLNALGNGTHRLVLGSSVDGCGTDDCVLAIFSGIKGVPPIATARLPIAPAVGERAGP
jgi:hypothetical protein